MANSELVVFYGKSHPELGEKILKHLKLKPGEIKISRFAGGEIYTRILENIRGHSCVVIQTCTQKVNEDLMELFIIIDSMKRASAKTITAVIPHFGYARQDRKAASREPISARLVANLLETAGADRIITMDLHSDQIQGFFNIPVDTLTALPIFTNYLKKKKLEKIVVVAPDTGRAKVAKKLADRLGAKLAILHKVRAEHHDR
jgi:ribose-phosphate pyrophosphokinase